MIAEDFYGDKFRWFTGVVKDVGGDSRVRVRIFGIHHTEDQTRVSDGDLPWAMVLYPTTGGQTSGGNASHGLVPGTWVVGFFVDGEDSQQPVVLGVINGGQGSTNNSPRGEAPTSSPSNPSGGDPTNTPTNPGDVTNTPSTNQLTGGTNIAKVYNFMWEKIKSEGAYTGDLKTICAAIIGNMQGEAGPTLSPTASNGNTIGLCQWLGPRKKSLGAFCGMTEIPSKSNAPPLEQQLDFTWKEFKGSHKSMYNKLIASSTVEDAVIAMCKFEGDESIDIKKGSPTYGQCITTHKVYQNKLSFARKALSSLSYTGGVT